MIIKFANPLTKNPLGFGKKAVDEAYDIKQ